MRSANPYWIGLLAVGLAAAVGLGLVALGRLAAPTGAPTPEPAPVAAAVAEPTARSGTLYTPQPTRRYLGTAAKPSPPRATGAPMVKGGRPSPTATPAPAQSRRTAVPPGTAPDPSANNPTANNRPPNLQGGGLVTAPPGKPVTLSASGEDPDGDNITPSWDIETCLTTKDDPGFDRAVVILGRNCDQAVATLTWTDAVGASASVSWQLIKPTPPAPPVDNSQPPPESDDEPAPREEPDGRNRTPIVRGGGIVRPTGGKPVNLRVRGYDPDGDNITHEWKLWCLEGSSLQMETGTVWLKKECDSGEAWLIWKDARGESIQVEWLIER